jgi:hypothetical protein
MTELPDDTENRTIDVIKQRIYNLLLMYRESNDEATIKKCKKEIQLLLMMQTYQD